MILFTPGAHLLEECAAELATFAGGSATSLCGELRTDPRVLQLTVRQALAGRGTGDDLVMVVDQFEEIFTLT